MAIGQVNSRFFGGKKPIMPWANVSGLPSDQSYTVPPLSSSRQPTDRPGYGTGAGQDGGTGDTTQPPPTDRPDLPTDPGIDVQPPPVTPPSYNPYTQQQTNYQTVYDSLSTLQPQIQGLADQYRTLTDEMRRYSPQGITPDGIKYAQAAGAHRTFVNESLPAALQPFQETLASYGFQLNLGNLDPFAQGDAAMLENLLTITSSTGEMPGTMSIGDAVNWLGSETTRLGDAATRHDEMTGFMEGFQDWATSYEAGETQVDPFADPNGWGEMVQSIFGDMQGLPDIQDLLEGMYDMMPVWEYTADALPNLTAPERMTKFFDDLKANGFDMEQMQGGLDQQLRDWLYAKAQELAPQRMFDQLGLDVSTWNQMNSEQIAEITKMLGRKSVFDDKDTRQYLQIKMREIKQINKAEYNQHLNVLAEKGITHGGAMVRSAQELSTRLGDAEMQATSELFMEGIRLAEEGRWEAMTTWGNISDTQAKLLTDIGNIKATLFGQYFGFIADIGNLSASEFATKTEAHVAEASLKLKYDLGVAGLEMDKFISEGVLNLEGLKLEYDNYWKDRGADLTEKQAEFDSAIAAWQTSSMMAEMVNSGRTERLVQMADLALKAQGGDREAWSMYQQLALREGLEQRGMDIDQAQSLADLTFQFYTFGETMDFNRWATQYDGLLRKELLRMNIQGQMDLAEFQSELENDGFFSSLFNVAGGAAKLYIWAKSGGILGGGGGGGGAPV